MPVMVCIGAWLTSYIYNLDLYKLSMQSKIGNTYDSRRRQAYQLQVKAYRDGWWGGHVQVAERLRAEGHTPVHRDLLMPSDDLSHVDASSGGMIVMWACDPVLVLRHRDLSVVVAQWRRIMDGDTDVWDVLEQTHPGIGLLYGYGMVDLGLIAVHGPRCAMMLGASCRDWEIPSEILIRQWLGIR